MDHNWIFILGTHEEPILSGKLSIEHNITNNLTLTKQIKCSFSFLNSFSCSWILNRHFSSISKISVFVCNIYGIFSFICRWYTLSNNEYFTVFSFNYRFLHSFFDSRDENSSFSLVFFNHLFYTHNHTDMRLFSWNLLSWLSFECLTEYHLKVRCFTIESVFFVGLLVVWNLWSVSVNFAKKFLAFHPIDDIV